MLLSEFDVLADVIPLLREVRDELSKDSTPPAPGEYCSGSVFRASLISDALKSLERAALPDTEMLLPREEDIPC